MTPTNQNSEERHTSAFATWTENGHPGRPEDCEVCPEIRHRNALAVAAWDEGFNAGFDTAASSLSGERTRLHDNPHSASDDLPPGCVAVPGVIGCADLDHDHAASDSEVDRGPHLAMGPTSGRYSRMPAPDSPRSDGERQQSEHNASEAVAWDAGVDAAFRGAIMRENAEDVKRRNPYRVEDEDYGPGCDCIELCSMGPTCPGARNQAGAGCWRTAGAPAPAHQPEERCAYCGSAFPCPMHPGHPAADEGVIT